MPEFAARLDRFFIGRPVPADAAALGECLNELIAAGLDQLPLPGAGRTLERWQALARVAAYDLSLCKLYEGHTDALAILQECGAERPTATCSLGTWAAEPPQARVHINARDSRQDVRLDGRKAWCSGAAVLSHALLTGWDEEGQQQLVTVALDKPGVTITDQGWEAVGMAATQSVEVVFEQARAHCVGPADGYLQRAGFWHGGAGIAACWYGAAQVIAEALRSHCTRSDEVHALAHLGAVDAALYAAAASLHTCAAWIDANPAVNAELPVRRARAVCEDAAETVLRHTGRALGAAPYCRDERLARRLADLPVFLRQSHAERDLTEQGRQAAAEPAGSWVL